MELLVILEIPFMQTLSCIGPVNRIDNVFKYPFQFSKLLEEIHQDKIFLLLTEVMRVCKKLQQCD